LLTVALPIAIDQGYFRYSRAALPLLGLLAVLLYAGFSVTSKWFCSFWRVHRNYAITLLIVIVVVIAVGFGVAYKKSSEHIAELLKKDAQSSTPQVRDITPADRTATGANPQTKVGLEVTDGLKAGTGLAPKFETTG
jgi:hypothetical protein